MIMVFVVSRCLVT
ncbi:hypothetical protein D039_2443A, partial [Vibrio parahaemolyticus EKP-028]